MRRGEVCADRLDLNELGWSSSRGRGCAGGAISPVNRDGTALPGEATVAGRNGAFELSELDDVEGCKPKFESAPLLLAALMLKLEGPETDGEMRQSVSTMLFVDRTGEGPLPDRCAGRRSANKVEAEAGVPVREMADGGRADALEKFERAGEGAGAKVSENEGDGTIPPLFVLFMNESPNPFSARRLALLSVADDMGREGLGAGSGMTREGTGESVIPPARTGRPRRMGAIESFRFCVGFAAAWGAVERTDE